MQTHASMCPFPLFSRPYPSPRQEAVVSQELSAASQSSVGIRPRAGLDWASGTQVLMKHLA